MRSAVPSAGSPGASPTATGAAIAQALKRAGFETRLDGPEHAAIFLDGARVTRLPLNETVHPRTLRAILRSFGVSFEQFGALLAQGSAPPATLGDILFAAGGPAPLESEWIALVRSIAARDECALRELYRRTHSIVFTLLLQLRRDREAARDLTLDVFDDVWRRALQYDATTGSVIGWVLNRARSLALGTSEAPAPSEHDRMRRDALAAMDDDDWREPPWREAARGLRYQLLAVHPATHVVTLRVRLDAGVEYPPHTHAGAEELHLLDGELWIDDRKLHPGDYNHADAGTSDQRVWTETGCSCVLVTSHRDVLK